MVRGVNDIYIYVTENKKQGRRRMTKKKGKS